MNKDINSHSLLLFVKVSFLFVSINALAALLAATYAFFKRFKHTVFFELGYPVTIAYTMHGSIKNSETTTSDFAMRAAIVGNDTNMIDSNDWEHAELNIRKIQVEIIMYK